MYGCGHRKKRGCANCGHEAHDGKCPHRAERKMPTGKRPYWLVCSCEDFRERPSRAVPWRARLYRSCPSPHQIDAFEKKHQREMQLKLIGERRKP